MGDCEPLIMTHRNVKIARDGDPLQMNLATGHTYNETNGNVIVQCWTQDQEIRPGSDKRYAWRCLITVPGGGLQPRTGSEFDFVAPEKGYQPSDEIVMSASNTKWNSTQSREYFLKLANGDFARVNFTMLAGGDNFFEITSYLNPTPGHRNLEFDPAKQIKP